MVLSLTRKEMHVLCVAVIYKICNKKSFPSEIPSTVKPSLYYWRFLAIFQHFFKFSMRRVEFMFFKLETYVIRLPCILNAIVLVCVPKDGKKINSSWDFLVF